MKLIKLFFREIGSKNFSGTEIFQEIKLLCLLQMTKSKRTEEKEIGDLRGEIRIGRILKAHNKVVYFFLI